MPCDYSKYPANWKTEIRPAILKRDCDKCKFCGVANYSPAMRGNKTIRIVLTIAHLDHDTNNNHYDNLAALCQRCHLRYDLEHHQTNAKATRDRKRGQADMLEGES